MYSTDSEKEVASIITSCILSYGGDGIPLGEIQEEFEALCGYPIPYKEFGFDDLSTFLITLPNIYIIKDQFRNDIVIEHSPKLHHIKQLISKQRKYKRKYQVEENEILNQNKRSRTASVKSLPRGASIHSSFNVRNLNDSVRFQEFNRLEGMLPILYKHQALGDDFFVDLADKKLGCYVSDEEPKKCGMCEVGLTIASLTEKVENAQQIAPRVVIMIGMNDLLMGRNANNMIIDLRKLVSELKKKNTRVTIVTLIPSPKLKMNKTLQIRMDIFNKSVIEYGTDFELQCNIIDMNKIFEMEIKSFKKDFDRLEKTCRNDQYRVFSDYGRKIFLNALKTCLREQVNHGH
ncbi:uncharacterized protein LOC123322233 [Coccinella septempunctata]|uniref:uncharacterized protein LOC123322233 n=1 Tax=Coccinella septempunctata TaxID=41139 RepID=UPI001D08A7AD|nr:uncharacterized protein LOC123322233 [Coccinella septempunctata]